MALQLCTLGSGEQGARNESETMARRHQVLSSSRVRCLQLDIEIKYECSFSK